MCGSTASHRPIACCLAHSFDGTVWGVDYRLLPEHPFPAALGISSELYRSGRPAEPPLISPVLADLGDLPQMLIQVGTSKRVAATFRYGPL